MKTHNITVGGISIALSITILYLTTLIPINTFAILTLASSIIPITLIKSNIKTAILVYVSTSIISFFILPINYSILYILGFGIYGIVKYYIEKLQKLTLEVLVKVIFFNLMLALGYILITTLVGNLNLKYSIWIFIFLAQIAFFIYDYALSIIINYYINKFHK